MDEAKKKFAWHTSAQELKEKRVDLRNPERQVVHALYELPAGGDWDSVQQSLCLYWSTFDQTESVEQQQSIQDLERHMERALQLLEQMPRAEHGRRNRLFQIPMPACLFDARGQLVDQNPKALELLGLTADRELRLGSAMATRVARTIKALMAGVESVVSVDIKSREGAELQAFLAPYGEGRFLAILVEQQPPAGALQMLVDARGLTLAEAKLCLQLAGGQSLEDVAQATAVSKNTLRTHLARSFSKLGVNSQPALVSLILQHLFALSQLESLQSQAPALTPYLDPELHGQPLFRSLVLRDGRSLGYFEYGDADGVPALYLHGSLDCGMFMLEQSQNMVGTGIRLICVERGGVGESEPSGDPRPEAYARDLSELLDQLDLQQAVVLGRSMGTWDALTLAATEPERVGLQVLVSGRFPVSQTTEHAGHAEFYRSLYSGIWNSSLMGNLMLRLLRMQLLVAGPGRFLPPANASADMIEHCKDPRFLAHMRACWLRSACHGPGPLHGHLSLYRHPVAEPTWAGCTKPTLLVHGAEDSNVPLDTTLKHTASFTQRRVEVLPGAGHEMVHWRMADILRLVRSAWDDLDRGQNFG